MTTFYSRQSSRMFIESHFRLAAASTPVIPKHILDQLMLEHMLTHTHILDQLMYRTRVIPYTYSRSADARTRVIP